MARPMAPATLRIRLISPEASFIRLTGRVEIDICCEAIIATMVPSPRATCSNRNSLKPHWSVTRVPS